MALGLLLALVSIWIIKRMADDPIWGFALGVWWVAGTAIGVNLILWMAG